MRLQHLGFVAAFSAAVFAGSGAHADSSGIRVEQAWARATPGGAKTGAIYLSVTNTGTTPDRLVSVATPAADKADLHEMKMERNVMEMRSVPAIDIPPGKTVTLDPNGFHIMLIGLKAPLKEGETVPLTLTFEHAGMQPVTASVAKIGAMHAGEMSAMPGMKMGH